jgi:hypothetical protein
MFGSPRAADCVLKTIPVGAANAAKHYLLPVVNTALARSTRLRPGKPDGGRMLGGHDLYPRGQADVV